jgi:hypothetical protein
VITGRFPELRTQFLWQFLNGPVLVPEWSRQINRQVQAMAGSDPAVVNPSTLLRLPGTIAWPWKPGRRPELTEWLVPPGGGHKVNLEVLRAKLPQVAPEIAPNGATTTMELLNPIRALIDQARAGPEWHNPVLRLVAKLVARGTSKSVILAMAEHLTWPTFTVEKTRAELATMIDGAYRRGFGGEGDVVDEVMTAPPKAPPPSLEIWDAGEDDYIIPPRGWLLSNVFCRGFLSSLLADGGVGKTAVRVAQLLSLASGRSLTGEHVFKRCRVLIISLEDDRNELRRRVYAALRHYNLTQDHIRGWLFLSAPKGLRLFVRGEKGRPQVGPLHEALIDAIEKYKPDIIALDPFIKAHGVDENDNNAIDLVCDMLALLAMQYNCSIDLPHHTRKGTMIAGNADAGRGASSMKDAGRLIQTLTPMTSEEAKQFGVSDADRRSLIRMDSGKVNIAPPSRAAKWFRLIGVPLGNASAEYPNGDEVQTIEVWTPPDLWLGLDHPLLNRILDDIEKGCPDGSRYSAANAAQVRAAWRVVVAHAPDRTEAQAREIIRIWLSSGTLYEERYHDTTEGKDRLGLRVDHTKRPS